MVRSIALAAVLTAAAAHADQTWVFEPGQSMISIEAGTRAARLSAVSLSLKGQLIDQDGGQVKAALQLDVSSFSTGSRARDEQLRAAAGDAITFEGSAPASARDGKLHFTGTLTVRGVAHPLELTLATVRMGTALFGHASFVLRLRDLGITLPAGLPDDAHVDLDAGLRPEHGTLASRG
jgi:polyisoprenoid-binding protein YceI